MTRCRAAKQDNLEDQENIPKYSPASSPYTAQAFMDVVSPTGAVHTGRNMLLRRPGSSRIRSNNQTGPVPRPEGLAFPQISRPRLTFREQLVGRFVQTLLLAASIRQMTN